MKVLGLLGFLSVVALPDLSESKLASADQNQISLAVILEKYSQLQSLHAVIEDDTKSKEEKLSAAIGMFEIKMCSELYNIIKAELKQIGYYMSFEQTTVLLYKNNTDRKIFIHQLKSYKVNIGTASNPSVIYLHNIVEKQHKVNQEDLQAQLSALAAAQANDT